VNAMKHDNDPLNEEELTEFYAAKEAWETEHKKEMDFFELLHLCLQIRKKDPPCSTLTK
jgi:hypothetical protein